MKIVGNNKLTVVKITGEAFRQTEDRLLIPIQKGDLIPEGEIIMVITPYLAQEVQSHIYTD
ncbi:MAG TPA: hypothetical protein PLY39_05440, partial [Synergistales bacterium]|nr:hypothetical protein [Synergistales bacterium]